METLMYVSSILFFVGEDLVAEKEGRRQGISQGRVITRECQLSLDPTVILPHFPLYSWR